ncbi:MAG: hypothetical protein HC872_05540 [Gammaproteobacteria bacterium]|nr:hypothetical protein [Gammaproteobacteria bacterium]
MPEDNAPPSGNEAATKELVEQFAQLRETLNKRSEEQVAIGRAMVDTATAMSSATDRISRTLETNTELTEANNRTLLSSRQLLVVLVSLSTLLLVFLVVRMASDGPAEHAAGSMGGWPHAKLLPVYVFAGLTAVLWITNWGMKRAGRTPPVDLDWLTRASAYATILAFLLALAEFFGDTLETGSEADELTVGFRVIGGEQPDGGGGNGGGGGGAGVYPRFLIGPFASNEHGVMDLKAALEDDERTCAPIIEERDLTKQVCAARTALADASLAIIIGRHDRNRLRGRSHYSNAALAERRADTVAMLFNDPDQCAPFPSEPPVVVTMSATPRVVMGKGMACDRMVEIVALKRGTRR